MSSDDDDDDDDDDVGSASSSSDEDEDESFDNATPRDSRVVSRLLPSVSSHQVGMRVRVLEGSPTRSMVESTTSARDSSTSRPNHPPHLQRLRLAKSMSMSTVKMKRAARLVEKLKEVYKLESITEVNADLPCWLLRSVRTLRSFTLNLE